MTYDTDKGVIWARQARVKDLKRKKGGRGELLESFKLSHARGFHQTLFSYTTV